nr:hypothetical protein [Cryobacterium breve]
MIRKIQCHDAYVVIRPPARGAMTGAASAGQVRSAMARIRSPFAVTRRTASRPTGTIMAPPAPCNTRLRVSRSRLGLAAHRIEATVKTAIAVRKTLRAPKRAVIHPLRGMSTASVSR